VWRRYKKLLKWFTSIFAYVDRHYVQLLQLMSLPDTGTNSFRMLVLDPVIEEVTKTILDTITAERRGEESKSVVASVVKIYVEVGLGKLYFYQRAIEEEYLRQLKTFLKREKEGRSGLGEEERKKRTEEVAEKEVARAKTLLHSTTVQKVADACATFSG